MSVEVIVRYGENIDSVLGKLRRGCMNSNLSAELKRRQYYVKPSLLRHAEDQELQRKKKYKKRKEDVVAKFGIDSVRRRKKQVEFH